MNLTFESANRLCSRFFTLLSAPGANAESKTLESVKDMFAVAAGAKSWAEFAAFLGAEQLGATKPDFQNYSSETVRHAIAKSLATTDFGWLEKAGMLLDTIYATSSSAFTSTEGIRAAMDFYWLEKQQDIRFVRNYFDKLPHYSGGDVLGAKALHDALVEKINVALSNWDLLLSPENCPVPPPMTCDILMRCVEQHVAWPDKWTDWFKVVRR